MLNVDSSTFIEQLLTDRGVDFKNTPFMTTHLLLNLARAESADRRRGSIYLADCIIELSDNYLLYKENLVHKRDLAIEMQIAENTDIFPDVLSSEREAYFKGLHEQFPEMSVDMICNYFEKCCKSISAKYLSNLLEVKTQWIYNARSIMRRYPLAVRPHDPAGILGVSHYQDVTKPNLTQVDSLRLLQEYLDAKQRGFYFSDDPDTLIEATPTELENRALGLNALRKGQRAMDEIQGKTVDPLPHTVEPKSRLQVVRGTRNMSKLEAQQIASQFGKNEQWAQVPDTTPINVQVTFYYEVQS